MVTFERLIEINQCLSVLHCLCVSNLRMFIRTQRRRDSLLDTEDQMDLAGDTHFLARWAATGWNQLIWNVLLAAGIDVHEDWSWQLQCYLLSLFGIFLLCSVLCKTAKGNWMTTAASRSQKELLWNIYSLLDAREIVFSFFFPLMFLPN